MNPLKRMWQYYKLRKLRKELVRCDFPEIVIDDISKLEHPKAFEFLVALLEYHHADEIRKRVAEVLGDSANSSAVEPLMKSLEDKERPIRNSSAESLGKLKKHITDEHFQKIVAKLNASDPEIRARCAVFLGKIRDKRAIEPLIGLLEDPVPMVIKYAAEALGKIKDRRAVRPLIEALDCEDSEVYLAVSKALIKHKSYITSGDICEIQSGYYNGRCKKGYALVLGEMEVKEEVVGPLIRLLRNVNPDVRKKAADVLKKIGEPKGVLFADVLFGNKQERIPELVPHLDTVIELLWIGDWTTTGHLAASVLGRLRDHITDEQYDKIVAGLKDDDVNHRLCCIEVLSEIGGEGIFFPLMDVVNTDPDMCVRNIAAWVVIKLVCRHSTESETESNYTKKWLNLLLNNICGRSDAVLWGFQRYVENSEDYALLRRLENYMYRRLREEPSDPTGFFRILFSEIIKRENELLAPEAEKLEHPMFKKRKKPKRRKVWRLEKITC